MNSTTMTAMGRKRARLVLTAGAVAALAFGAVGAGRALAQSAGAGSGRAPEARQSSTNRSSSTTQVTYSDDEGNVVRADDRDGDVKVYLNGELVATKRPGEEWDRIQVADADGETVATIVRTGRGGFRVFGGAEDPGETADTAVAAWLLEQGDAQEAARVYERLARAGQTPFAQAFGVAERPKVMMGVVMGEPDEALATHLGVDPGDVTMFVQVTEGLPAAKAGIKRFDIATKLNGETPADQEAIRAFLRKAEPGDTMRLELLRGRERKDVTLELQAYDAAALGAVASGGGASGIAQLFETPGAFAWRTEQREEQEAARRHMQELIEKISEKQAQMHGRTSEEVEALAADLARAAEEVGRVMAEQAERQAQELYRSRVLPQIQGQIQGLPDALERERVLQLEREGNPPMRLYVTPRAPAAPTPPPAPGAPSADVEDRLRALDDRLERLEAMLEKLLERESARKPDA